MININIEFRDARKFDNLIRYIENNLLYAEAQEYMLELADNTVENMRNTIRTEKKRPSTGEKLEQTIDKEILSTTAGVDIGIGRISTLTKETPYWEVLNNGGYIPNHGNFVPLGAFVPGEPKPSASNFRQGNWEVGSGKYTFRAKRPIEGIDYIGKAIRELDKDLKETIIKMGGTFIQGLEKAGS